jgi:hypothetical protein
MILPSRIEDRKAVLGLFNAAYDLMHTGSEASFPRLGQMIADYEQPLRKLSEDLGLSYRVFFKFYHLKYQKYLADQFGIGIIEGDLFSKEYFGRTAKGCRNDFVDCQFKTNALCDTNEHGFLN